MTKLFIEGIEIELDENVQFAITKQFEELSDPTTIINDWSKTVSIPFTSKNNETFGHIYNPDKLIVTGSENDNYVGIYFDPTKKLDFRLEYGDTVLMTGYAKMTEIKQSKGRGSYEISLFGTLGKVLQEMSKITFDQTSPDEKYIIDGAKYVSETYNKELIYNSWTSEGQTHSQLFPRKLNTPGGVVNHPAYRITDIIGFAPNNSFDTEFDYKSYQTTDSSGNIIAQKFTTALENVQFEETTGISPDNVIPDGLMPREIGEYRSYLQLPFIYWNKLFQIFKEKTEEITGYTFDLDEWWFNIDNPYWFNLVYMLQRGKFEDKKDAEEIFNTYVPEQKQLARWNIIYPGGLFNDYDVKAYNVEQNYDIKFSRNNSSETFPILDNDDTTYDLKKLSDYGNLNQLYTINIPFALCRYNYYRGGIAHIPTRSYKATTFKKNALLLNIDIINESNIILKTLSVCVASKNFTPDNASNYDLYIPYNEDNDKTNIDLTGSSVQPEGNLNKDYERKKIGTKYSFLVNYQFVGTYNSKLKFRTRASFFNDSSPMGEFGETDSFLTFDWEKTKNIKISFEEKKRSDSSFILNDLWNNDVNLFEEIIRYCKMFHILINVDDIKKTISFKPMFKNFENYSIVDWTDKVDKSKDFNITPVTLEDKYVVFNNESTNTNLSKEYKEEVGLTYGSYRLITHYNFNNNTKELFKKCKESITNTDNVLSWTNLFINKRVVYSLPAEIYVYNKDKDKKFVNVFGTFYFHNGLRMFNTEAALSLMPVVISDDSDYMKFNKNYFYVQEADPSLITSCDTYPNLDVIYNMNLCLFAAPKKIYTYNNEYSYKNGIYNNFWQNYIDERYNIQNKKVTCYINLTPVDYINFNFNKFVKIGNQLYMVNKIYDYNVTSNNPTKVDLITIQNIGAYTNKTYQYDYIRIYSSDMQEIGIGGMSNIMVPYDHYRKIYIESNKQWNIESSDWTDYLSIEPTQGNAGITPVYIGSINEEGGYEIEFYISSELDSNQKIKTKNLNVNIGGETSLSVSPWFNDIQQGGSATITINSSSNWKIVHQTNDELTISPTSGLSGNTSAIITAPLQDNLLTDFYIENDASDIVSVRGYVRPSLIKLSSNYLELSTNTQGGIIVSNDAAAGWHIKSITGTGNATITPTTGAANSETQVIVNAGSTIGTTYITLEDIAGNNFEATLIVDTVDGTL